MSDCKSTDPDEAERWSNPRYIADQLANIGYSTNKHQLDDHELLFLAGMGHSPSLFPKRMDVVCRIRGIAKPAGFSPSNIGKVSEEKIKEFAKIANVTSDWLITGLVDDNEESYDGPDFLRPYVDLRSDALALCDLVRWHGYLSVKPDKMKPWEWSRAICKVLADAKKTEKAYWDNRKAQEQYRRETRDVRGGIDAVKDHIRT